MPLYEVTEGGLKRQPVAAFAALGMYERADLQRLLRDDISALGEDLLVVAEEFGNWEDARRRIDLLAIDRAGHLVVIELKRTDDGGHMDLQAIRYAAMVSSMDFAAVASAYSTHCAKHRPEDEVDARAELEAFLDVADGGDEPAISTDVRIILVSADFGREITTTVLWLIRSYGMDVRCVRLVPYEIDDRVLLDLQQVLPLPEAADYQVRVGRKDAARDRARADGKDYTRYHVVVDGAELPDQNKRNAVRVMVEQLANRGIPLAEIRKTLPGARMRVVPGQFTDGAAVREALAAADPDVELHRWFSDHALVDAAAGETYVLSKMWGRQTESTLAALAAAFHEAKVTFRRADSTAV
ncbi:MAG: hypothetical protein M3404_00070 [Actinomycetota bacterium]|nr:hypothetical protein [Actinomycetota bacterium]